MALPRIGSFLVQNINVVVQHGELKRAEVAVKVRKLDTLGALTVAR